jgi:hypothetical protein
MINIFNPKNQYSGKQQEHKNNQALLNNKVVPYTLPIIPLNNPLSEQVHDQD